MGCSTLPLLICPSGSLFACSDFAQSETGGDVEANIATLVAQYKASTMAKSVQDTVNQLKASPGGCAQEVQGRGLKRQGSCRRQAVCRLLAAVRGLVVPSRGCLPSLPAARAAPLLCRPALVLRAGQEPSPLP